MNDSSYSMLSNRVVLNKKRPLLIDFVLKHSLQGEQWKQVLTINEDGTLKPQDYWYVSNKGRVLSIYNDVVMFLSLEPDKDGYIPVKFDGHEQKVHRLVATAFLPMEQNVNYRKMYVHHIDHNKINNDVKNLMWLSPQEHNTLHAKEKKEKKQQEEIADNA